MQKYTRPLLAPLALAVALVAGACGEKKPDNSALAQDSSLNRDLAMANRDSAAQPQLKDVPAAPAATATPAPATTTPAPKPTAPPKPAPKPAAKMGTIAAGTTLALISGDTVCTNTYKKGGTFTATTAEAVTGSNGAMIPAGSTVTLTIDSLKRSENASDPIVMKFSVSSLTIGSAKYSLSGEVASADITKVKNQPGGKTAQKVAVGAAAGAIAGKLLGKSTKATVVGGLVGAGAGAVVAKQTQNYEGCVNKGARITAKLGAAVDVRA
jgi:hypothetical protein